MNDKVLTIEQMQHLQELGLDTSDASMYWELRDDDDNSTYYKLNILDFDKDMLEATDIPTYTLQDILEKFPREIDTGDYGNWFELTHCGKHKWSCDYCYDASDPAEWSDSEASESVLVAAYSLLCWCLENKCIG